MATLRNRFQFQGLFSELFTHVGTVDVASTVDAAGVSQTFTVPGVVLGDMVLAFSFGVSLSGMTATAYVSAADTVTIRIQNESAGTVDLASTTVKILVGRPSDAAFVA
jgi:hypothetical protein